MSHETQHNSLFYDTECMPPLLSVYKYNMSASIELGVLFLYCLLVPGTPVTIHITSILIRCLISTMQPRKERKKERKKKERRKKGRNKGRKKERKKKERDKGINEERKERKEERKE